MPSKTFFNLSEEKRSRLIHAAMKEFSACSFNEASINRIIKQADIPRGSFYQYFENKEDLYFYLVKDINFKFEQMFQEAIAEANGDLFEGVRSYYPQFLTMLMDNAHTNFFKQLFLHMDYRASKKFTPEELAKQHEGIHAKSGIITSIDKNLLEVDSQEDLQRLAHLIVYLMVHEVTEGFAGEFSQEKMKNNFYQKLRWIEHGARRSD